MPALDAESLRDSEHVQTLLTRCTFPPASNDDVVECAVSGGADSSALLVLAVAHGLPVRAVYVDHGLRAESAADGETVRVLSESLGVPFACRSLALEPGANLEARARLARYDALAAGVLTGHTADDLAETMLFNFARGAALAGLAPMRERAGGPRRPILGLRRAETASLCRELGITVVSDSMNFDPTFSRVRVRREVLPLLSDVLKRDAVEVIARQWPILRDDDELLESLASALDATDARALAAAPLPLARRAVRRWLRSEGVTGEHRADRAVVERVLLVARGEAIAADLVGGWRVLRTQQQLRVERIERPPDSP